MNTPVIERMMRVNRKTEMDYLGLYKSVKFLTALNRIQNKTWMFPSNMELHIHHKTSQDLVAVQHHTIQHKIK
ncbi:hypothetical protein TSUD_82750 [Trifolium subterraneum]|uniref:Uncharacterized protein n=1 Tax=Trifolium subterraneum TaxID=3900 RepID=A0A2Z6LL74_TRISU|nr:hypothetical protein TSUD_82750 [Trifolium subterraneum]